MVEQEYVIGVDIGTTSTKAVIFTTNGKAVEEAYAFYPLIKTVPDMAEQDPETIFEAVLASIRSVMEKASFSSERILCVSFSSAMHSLILMDKNDQPLTRSITWADNRAAVWSDRLKQENGMDIYHRTGTPIHPMSPLSKIIWLREEQPRIFQAANKFIGIKEYVFHRLFGRYAVDYSIASSTGLFNTSNFEWDELALETAGITKGQLSKLVSPTDRITGIDTLLAERMGLLSETPVVFGGNDGCLSNLGLGAVEPKVAAITIGTSGAIRMVTNQPFTDPSGRTFCYVLDEEHWIVGGAVNNGGVVLDWAYDLYCETQQLDKSSEKNYRVIMEKIESVPAGANGLFFHPYLNGERAPLWDSDARGSFFGINMLHRPEHFLRAVLEGISFNLYDVLHILAELAGKPEKIMATGGFSKSLVWRQMLTDVFQQKLTLPESVESSCLGAAVFGLKSLGIIQEITEVKTMVGAAHDHEPNFHSAEIYRKMFPVYHRLSQTFSAEYQAVADFQRSLELE